MKTIIIAVIIAVSAHIRNAAANMVLENEEMEAVTGVRTVFLGLFMIYDGEAKKRWGNEDIFNPDDYLNTMVQMAERVHFGNLTCANISLVLLGTQELNESSGVEVMSGSDLDVKATLTNLRNYSSKHRKEFGSPDMIVLVTGLNFKHEKPSCRTSGSMGDHIDGAYCASSQGATYFKGMCKNDSVGIIEDYRPKLYGATSLAQQIARQMGVLPDEFRNESECPRNGVYFTAKDWRNPSVLQHVGLSECAQKDLVNYIDSMGNSSDVCWTDIPNATSPEVDFESHNICQYQKPRSSKCNYTAVGNNPCNQYCCLSLQNCTAEDQKQTGCEERHGKVFHPGKRCGNNGICFEGKCFL